MTEILLKAEEIYVFSSAEATSVTIYPRNTASASSMDWFETLRKCWYVNRVFVEVSLRRQRVGTRLVRALQESVVKQGGLYLLVEPGGYGSDLAMLERFYRSVGFDKHPQIPEGLVWCAAQEK